ncbi:MAG: putative Ig domain-containing protein [Cyclobacteriaceae bacterium]
MKRNNTYYWFKLQRRYRNAQAKWIESRDSRIARKLDILGRRIHALNRKWNLGIASATLSAWLAIMPATDLQAQVFPATFELSTLDGNNGFTLNGVAANDETGKSVSYAGDVNGDGVEDLIIAARYADPNGSFSGEVYVVFGSSNGFAPTFELSALDGSNGFNLNGVAANDYAGYSVSNAGDVNGDGVDDLIIGAHGVNSYTGASYVVFGSSSGFAQTFELSALDGSNGFKLNGVAAGDHTGGSVSNAGDVNGDGLDDIIIAARYADPNGSDSGEAYVVFGSSSGFASEFELSSLNGINGFTISGAAPNISSGFSVSGAGDVNSDGIDDLIIGALRASPNGTYSGASYVVFGTGSGFASVIELSALNGTTGFTVNGVAADDLSGSSVNSVGDVNGDGLDDFIIGAIGSNTNGTNSGASYVVFGNGSGFAPTFELSSLNGSNGFTINGSVGSFSGRSVSSAGDMNGDGVDDIIIGAAHASPNGGYSGQSYVVFGSSSGFTSVIELSTLDGNNGFALNGVATGQQSGYSVSKAGDVNGDGIDDLIIGAHLVDTNGSKSGASYVVFGRREPIAPTVANPISDQQGTEDQVFNFLVPTNTFDDINVADTQTLSATLAGGEALPSWLIFDAGTNEFNGTPANDDVGTISVEVTATDADGLSVSDVFDLEVVNVNDAPILAAIGSQNGNEGVELTFTVSATDVDLPANTLTFSLDATSTGKGMTIDSSTGAFIWTPDESQVGTHTVIVTVSDGSLSDEETIAITIEQVLGFEDDPATVNIYPNPSRDQVKIEGLPKLNTVTFYSLTGAVVLFEKLKGEILDITPLENGAYVLVIRDSAGKVLLKSRLLKTD